MNEHTRERAELGSEARPRILYIVRSIPYLPSQGGLTRAYHMVRAATEVGDVTLVGAAEEEETARLDMMQPLCQEIHLVPHPPLAFLPPQPPWRNYLPHRVGWALAGIRTMLGTDPWPAAHYDRTALRAKVRNLLVTGHFDLVVVEHTQFASLLYDIIRDWNGPAVVDMHNVLYMLERRKLNLRLQEVGRRRPSVSGWRLVQQVRAREREIVRSYSRVIAVSEIDRAALQRLVPRKPVDVIPNGVDVEYFGAVGSSASGGWADSDSIVFTGHMLYVANIDAMKYFVAEIWPLIRGRRPEVQLHIVGGDPTAEVEALGERDGVSVFGSVPDVRPYLAAGSVAIVPLRLGAGTRLKILEALAAGRPVVSTSLGAEGLDLRDGHDLLLADTPLAFAEAVVRLLEQPEEAHRLARQGRETVSARYSWQSITQTFSSLLQDTLATHAYRATGS
jgi:sugar transferase (PEP-CTERM/EpsH1 system associated)